MSTNLDKHQSPHPLAVSRIGHFYDEVTRLVELVRPARILNIGCGEGFDAKNLGDRHADINYCCGLDLDWQALTVSRTLSCPFLRNTVNGDAHRLPLRLNWFDMILCLEVLEHLKQPEAVLMDIARRYDEYCIFSVPNEPLYRLTRLLVLRRDITRFGDHPDHLNHWSRRAFTRLLARYFTVEKVASPFPWTIALCRNKGATG